ncbi:MAG: NAD-dependent succinate-semialdehyde dehydrogenase [Microbacterium sp.]
MSDYPELRLAIGGEWISDTATRIEIIDPATENVIGSAPSTDGALLRRAAATSVQGFDAWRRVTPRERARILARAADLLEERIEENSLALTLEQGKPLHESRAEWMATTDVVRWFGEEARRTYGRVIPGGGSVRHLSVTEPVGPVLAMTPWNVPALAAGRKVAPALAAGCSVVLKAPSETPSASYAIIRALHDAGVPAEAAQLVIGRAQQISEVLIASEEIRKISFTGSTKVGRVIGALAGAHLKRSTLELGGHAPVLVFGDVDPVRAAQEASRWKFRNAGQICASPTRFLVHHSIEREFAEAFAAHAAGIQVGAGVAKGTEMGPLVSRNRVQAVDELVLDATAQGAELLTGGPAEQQSGYFYRPTVLAGVPHSAKIMTEEPFGPVAPIASFEGYDDAIRQANDITVGLASFVITDSARVAQDAAADLRAGIVGINDYNCSRCEIPFGGIKDTGWGQEGGAEGIEPYLVRKAVLSV